MMAPATTAGPRGARRDLLHDLGLFPAAVLERDEHVGSRTRGVEDRERQLVERISKPERELWPVARC